MEKLRAAYRNCYYKIKNYFDRELPPKFPRPIPKAPLQPTTGSAFSRMVRGSMSQASLASPYRNSQCTSMALTAAIYHHYNCIDRWQSKDIDRILRYGDSNHRQFREQDKLSTVPDGRIGLSDLRDIFVVDRGSNPGNKTIVRMIENRLGPVIQSPDYADELKMSYPPLVDFLGSRLTYHTPVVATIGEFSVLFTRVRDTIWLFDSHARDRNGRYRPFGGKAFIAPFRTARELEKYLAAEYGDQQYDASVLRLYTAEDDNEQHQLVVRGIIQEAAEEAIKKNKQGWR